MKAPAAIETERLLLRRPRPDDAEAIFTRYAADSEVTRLLSWSTHKSPIETRRFLQFSDTEWNQWPAGPYVIETRSGGELLGGTGFAFETSTRASIGYVLARDAWGKGYTSEAVRALVTVAGPVGVRRVHALCHAEHRASARVLEKCGFIREGLLRRHSVFPNLGPEPADVLCYAYLVEGAPLVAEVSDGG